MFAQLDWGAALFGSPILMALVVFSVVAMSATLERLAYYLRRRGDVDRMVASVLECLRDRDVKAAARVCAGASHPFGAVTKRLLEESGSPDQDEETILIALSEEKLLLERNLGTLGSIAAIAPLVGLLGTVWGIMRAFFDMSTSGSAAPAVVAGGVAEALTTTAAGLIIAVPAVLVYNHFTRRMNVMLTTAENGVRRVRSELRDGSAVSHGGAVSSASSSGSVRAKVA